MSGERARFRVFHRGHFVTELGLRPRGSHNLLGALATLAVCSGLGISVRDTREALEEYEGQARDFEARGSYRGVTLVDDAFEPGSSMRALLERVRAEFPGRRLVVVVDREVAPAGPERPREDGNIERADVVVPWPPDSGGVGETEAPTLREGLGNSSDVDAALARLERILEPGDVLLTLGSNEVGTIADALIRRLPRDRPGR